MQNRLVWDAALRHNLFSGWRRHGPARDPTIRDIYRSISLCWLRDGTEARAVVMIFPQIALWLPTIVYAKISLTQPSGQSKTGRFQPKPNKEYETLTKTEDVSS